MIIKTILYNENARKTLKKGMYILNEVVSITLGPRGRNVVLEKKFGTPQIVNDGITIAKKINLTDKLENIGVSLICQAASKTNETAGDGTTTATVLAYSIINQGMQNVVAGANPTLLKKGMEKASQFVIQRLTEYATPIENLVDISKIATISAGNDRIIGNLISNALSKVGREGLILLEETKSIKTTLNITEGMKFKRGFISNYFVTNLKKMEVIFTNPYILLTDKKIISIKRDLLPTLELITKTSKALLIISDSIAKDALTTLIINTLRGILKVVAVKAPGFGKTRKTMLDDLAILTNAKVMTTETGLSLENMKINYLGKAKKIIVDKESTTIISDATKRKIFKKCEQLRYQLEITDSSYEKQKLQERLAKLASGVAVIGIGATTETEMRERKLRLEDAINSTKAAIEEGIIPGGGSALTHIGLDLLKWSKKNLLEEELIGALIIERALSAPLKRIASNAGANSILIAEYVKNANFEIGYNALLNKFENMYLAGIVDPAKVTRTTLQNATSIASMILTTEALIVTKRKGTKKNI